MRKAMRGTWLASVLAILTTGAAYAEPNHPSLSADLQLTTRPFSSFDTGIGTDLIYYPSAHLGLGLTGQILFDGVPNTTPNFTYMHVEVGGRAKFYVMGDNATSGIVLAPDLVYITWVNTSTVPTTFSRGGARLTVDVLYEANLGSTLFWSIGPGLGVYLANPALGFVVWDSTFLAHIVAHLGFKF